MLITFSASKQVNKQATAHMSEKSKKWSCLPCILRLTNKVHSAFLHLFLIGYSIGL